MSELTFHHLATNANAPSDIFVITDGKLYLDIGALIGEAVADATAQKVVETCYKLIKLASLAETQYNTDNSLTYGSQLVAFSDPSYSTPTEAGGSITANVSISVTAKLAVNGDIVTSPIG